VAKLKKDRVFISIIFFDFIKTMNDGYSLESLRTKKELSVKVSFANCQAYPKTALFAQFAFEFGNNRAANPLPPATGRDRKIQNADFLSVQFIDHVTHDKPVVLANYADAVLLPKTTDKIRLAPRKIERRKFNIQDSRHVFSDHPSNTGADRGKIPFHV
jgi:hypothetical protein